MKVSIIIPALNESASIGGAIESAVAAGASGTDGEGAVPCVEVIVSDGGSVDDTVGIAEAKGAKVVKGLPGPSGRGSQMDLAARGASGDVFVFLHADARLPRDWYSAVSRALDDPGVVGGAFGLSIDSPGWWFRMVERVVGVRSRWFGLFYGDQGVFIRRSVFFDIGGFRALPLMEDVDLARRLKRAGRAVCLEERVSVSARRWVGEGAFLTGLRNWAFLALYYAGVSPARLYDWYYAGRGD